MRETLAEPMQPLDSVELAACADSQHRSLSWPSRSTRYRHRTQRSQRDDIASMFQPQFSNKSVTLQVRGPELSASALVAQVSL